jgi:hypothetical protein
MRYFAELTNCKQNSEHSIQSIIARRALRAVCSDLRFVLSVLLCVLRALTSRFEFRGFIYKKKFTALTQYNEYCFFPFLAVNKDRVLAQIEAQVSLHGRIHQTNAC